MSETKADGKAGTTSSVVETKVELELIRIDAEILIDGSSPEPASNRTVIFERPVRVGLYGCKGKGKIVRVAPTSELKGDDRKYAEHRSVKCLMPGMWDCHCHLFGIKSFDYPGTLLKGSPAACGARCAGDVKAALEAGFTSVRELSGLGIDVREAVEDGSIPGPNIFAAGGALSITCGHGDLHDFPLDVVCDIWKKWAGADVLCDGVPEVLKATRAQIRRGADVIKVMASGGVLSKRDNPHHQEFNNSELEAIVAEARSKDRAVAAHCHGTAGIASALRAGCKTVEHGTWLTAEQADEMRKTGTILVPTVLIQRKVAELGRKMGASEESMIKIAEVVKQHSQTMKMAIAKGVPIALGTDIFSSGPDSPCPWGSHAKELEYMVELGMSPMAAIQSATSVAVQTLGPRAPKAGVIAVGYDADLLTVKVNPLDKIASLQQQENITGVYKGGLLLVDRYSAGAAAAVEAKAA